MIAPTYTHRRYHPGRQGIQLSRFSGGNMSLPSTNPKQPAPQESSPEKLFDFFNEKTETKQKKPGMHESISASYTPGLIHDR